MVNVILNQYRRSNSAELRTLTQALQPPISSKAAEGIAWRPHRQQMAGTSPRASCCHSRPRPSLGSQELGQRSSHDSDMQRRVTLCAHSGPCLGDTDCLWPARALRELVEAFASGATRGYVISKRTSSPKTQQVASTKLRNSRFSRVMILMVPAIVGLASPNSSERKDKRPSLLRLERVRVLEDAPWCMRLGLRRCFGVGGFKVHKPGSAGRVEFRAAYRPVNLRLSRNGTFPLALVRSPRSAHIGSVDVEGWEDDQQPAQTSRPPALNCTSRKAGHH